MMSIRINTLEDGRYVIVVDDEGTFICKDYVMLSAKLKEMFPELMKHEELEYLH